MSNPRWSYREFVRWLESEGDRLAALGAAVEFHVQRGRSPSVRLRVELGMRLSELTVWEDGSAHVAVVDLESGDFVFERDGISVAGLSSQSGLEEFFDEIEGRE
jgi:hypothetical protein